jgi:hypothetical protein
VLELVPRDDRTAERRVFEGFGCDRFRTPSATYTHVLTDEAELDYADVLGHT